MNYAKLRVQIYRNEIKQLIDAISRIGLLVAVLFINVLIPVFFLGAMMSVGIIAHEGTSLAERVVYQGIYLVFLFILIKVQAKAILGTPYHYYLDSIPVKSWQKWRCDIELTVAAGNLVLLAPFVLCFFLPDLQTLLDNLFFVVFALSVLMLSQVALHRQNVPVVSLIILPFVAAYWLPDTLTLNLVWFFTIALEWLFIDKLVMDLQKIRTNHYVKVIALFVMHRPVNFLARGLGVLALVGSYAYVVKQRPDFALESFQLGVSIAMAALIGSYQFEVERFRAQYHYFLRSLPHKNSYYRLIESLPLIVLLLVLNGASWMADFSPFTVFAQYILTVITAISVRYINSYYFIPPLLTGILLVWFSMQRMI